MIIPPLFWQFLFLLPFFLPQLSQSSLFPLQYSPTSLTCFTFLLAACFPFSSILHFILTHIIHFTFSFHIFSCTQGVTNDVVFLGWPIAHSYMSSNAGWGGGEGVAGSQPMSTAVHRSPNKLRKSNSIFNLWLFSFYRKSLGSLSCLSCPIVYIVYILLCDKQPSIELRVCM